MHLSAQLNPSLDVVGKAGKKRALPHKDWRCWYQLERWRRRRRLHLQTHPLCAMCLNKYGMVRPAVIVDHVEAHRGDWNEFVLGEIQSLCEHCHNSEKRLEDLGKSRDKIGIDGWSDNERPCASDCDRPSRVDARATPSAATPVR